MSILNLGLLIFVGGGLGSVLRFFTHKIQPSNFRIKISNRDASGKYSGLFNFRLNHIFSKRQNSRKCLYQILLNYWFLWWFFQLFQHLV